MKYSSEGDSEIQSEQVGEHKEPRPAGNLLLQIPIQWVSKNKHTNEQTN